MKAKSTYLILTVIIIGSLLTNIRLLHINRQNSIKMEAIVKTVDYLTEVEFMHTVSKELTVSRIMYEQHDVSGASVYFGSDKNALLPLRTIMDGSKLVLGLNQTMCAPCVHGVLDNNKEIFPDFDTNPDILLIADLEQRFKDNYYNKKVLSFSEREDFPLYSLGMPYFFILDKDLVVKMLFITDKTSPELTREYLETVKERYFDK